MPETTTFKPTVTEPFIVDRVVDGDTLSGRVKTAVTIQIPTIGDIEVDIWLPVVVRLAHIDTPEHNTDAGKAAIEFVTDWLNAQNGVLYLQHSEQREKYGRLLGVVMGQAGGALTLNQTLLDSGNAKPYEGGKK